VTEDEAWLIVRMAHAIGEEGIGHHVYGKGDSDADKDGETVSRAVDLVWGRMDEWMRADMGYMSRPGT
jgi:hypothetical protein